MEFYCKIFGYILNVKTNADMKQQKKSVLVLKYETLNVQSYFKIIPMNKCFLIFFFGCLKNHANTKLRNYF